MLTRQGYSQDMASTYRTLMLVPDQFAADGKELLSGAKCTTAEDVLPHKPLSRVMRQLETLNSHITITVRVITKLF